MTRVFLFHHYFMTIFGVRVRKLRNHRLHLASLLIFMVALQLVACSSAQSNSLDVPFNSFLGSTEFISGESNRFPFAIVSLDGHELEGADIMVDFYFLGLGEDEFKFSKKAYSLVLGSPTNHVHDDGSIHEHGAKKNVYVVQEVEFDISGYWESRFRVSPAGGVKPMPNNLAFHVISEPLAVAIGQSIPRIDKNRDDGSITKQDIDTEEFDTFPYEGVISSGKPSLIVWASPLFCSSKLCSPVIEEVVAIQDQYRDNVRFIRIEPWDVNLAREKGILQFTENAKIWGLHSEPWVYLVDKSGLVVDRFEGPVSSEELEYSINSLLSRT